LSKKKKMSSLKFWNGCSKKKKTQENKTKSNLEKIELRINRKGGRENIWLDVTFFLYTVKEVKVKEAKVSVIWVEKKGKRIE